MFPWSHGGGWPSPMVSHECCPDSLFPAFSEVSLDLPSQNRVHKTKIFLLGLVYNCAMYNAKNFNCSWLAYLCIYLASQHFQTMLKSKLNVLTLKKEPLPAVIFHEPEAIELCTTTPLMKTRTHSGCKVCGTWLAGTLLVGQTKGHVALGHLFPSGDF